MAYKHGISVYETETSIVAPIESDSAMIVAVGTAPVNLIQNPIVNEPVIAYSYKEAVEKMGYSSDFKSYTLCEVMDVAFRKFGICPIVMINVLDPQKHKKSQQSQEFYITDNKVVIAEQGILLKSIIIKDSTESVAYQLGVDYETAFDSDNNVVIHILSEGSAINETSVKISYDSIDVSAVTQEDIIGGYDNIAKKYKGLECISQVYGKLGVIPGQIIAPGYSQYATVASVMRAKTENISGLFRATAVVDIDSSAEGAESYDMVYEWKNKNSYVHENMICCYPMVKIGDAIYHYSTIFVALTAQTDAKNGNIPYVSASNKELPITALITESGKSVYLDMSQANLLNANGVCTAINLNGWRSWGNNTSIYPASTDVKDRFIPIKRFFIWWSNTFIQTYFQKVDNPMNRRLIDAVVDSENIRANGYVARNIIAGANIAFYDNENPITDLLNGTIRFHQYLTPFPPAEAIENTLEFDPNMLQSALRVLLI